MGANTIFGDPIIQEIKAELRSATIAWKSVADLLSKAEMRSSAEGFKAILSAVGLKKSKASKLISIARCQRFAAQSDRFDTATAWTTLYELTTLTDAEFQQLLTNLKSGDVLTHSLVQQVKLKEPRGKKSAANKVAFSIRVVATAMRNGSITPEQQAQVRAKLKEIADISPYIRVDDADLFEQRRSGFALTTNQSTDLAGGAHVN